MESAGILLFRRSDGAVEVLLGHPGGPLWRRRDEGAWSIPKGEIDPAEDHFAAAVREFQEETGWAVEEKAFPLGSITQRGGKVVHAWAVQGDVDADTLRSNTFEMEWPPRSGRRREFPEMDRFAWYGLEEAARKINGSQAELLERLVSLLVGG